MPPQPQASTLRSRGFPLPDGPELDLLFVRCAEDQPIHVDRGKMDAVRLERSDRHNLLDLDDADLAAGRCRLVEVACGLAEQEVPAFIGLPALDDRQVGADATFEDIFLS